MYSGIFLCKNVPYRRFLRKESRKPDRKGHGYRYEISGKNRTCLQRGHISANQWAGYRQGTKGSRVGGKYPGPRRRFFPGFAGYVRGSSGRDAGHFFTERTVQRDVHLRQRSCGKKGWRNIQPQDSDRNNRTRGTSGRRAR